MKIRLSFTTCLTTEAIDEINIVLNAAGYPNVTENDLISSKPVEKEDESDFDDTRFTFEIEVSDDDFKTIYEKIGSKGIDVDQTDHEV